MPELPEVETVRRGLAPALVGAKFSTVEQRRADLRFPFPADFAARLTSRSVTALRRRAKYLLVDLDDGETLVMHLGMSGSFRIEDDAGENTPGLFHNSRGKDAAHDHVVFHLSNGKRITYNDPRRFGFMLLVKSDLLAAHPLFRDVGLEPLSEALNGTALAQLFSGKKAPLKAALLDQRLIAGPRQHLCQRGATSRRTFSAPCSRLDRAQERHGVTARRTFGEVHSRGSARSGQGRRLVVARPPPDQRRSRLFPA